MLEPETLYDNAKIKESTVTSVTVAKACEISDPRRSDQKVQSFMK
jgi:hypothetical protein